MTVWGGLLAQADQAILAAFEDLVGVALTGPQLAQVYLPFSAGGCGVRAPLQTRPAARISGILGYLTGGAAAIGAPDFCSTLPAASVLPVLEDLASKLTPNFDPLALWMDKVELLSSATTEHSRQKFWSEALGKSRVLGLLDQLPTRDQARLLEQTNSIGSAWMIVPPSPLLHSIIPSEADILA